MIEADFYVFGLLYYFDRIGRGGEDSYGQEEWYLYLGISVDSVSFSVVRGELYKGRRQYGGVFPTVLRG